MIEAEGIILDEDIWGGDTPPTEIETLTHETLGSVVVHHVADNYRKYPGELITLFTCVELREDVSNLTLRISIPTGLVLGDYRPPAIAKQAMPSTEVTEGATYMVWSLDGDLSAGSRYEYQTEVRIAPVQWDIELESLATISDEAQDLIAQESVEITVRAKGRYLKYLPAIYEQDDLMGRFLMLLESFWSPLEQQIDNEHYYFDPRLTPPSLLSWLASWLDLSLDERWPEAKQRQLIRWAIALHRSRGTKWGLLKYLEIFTGKQAEIVERRASNFVLGPGARLGQGIALGRGNRPHTFVVNLRLPGIDAESEQEREYQEKLRRSTIESIIDMQKPAHTVYTLNIETISPEESNMPAQTASQDGTADGQTDEIAAQAAIWFKLEGEGTEEGDTQPPDDDVDNDGKPS